MRRNRTMIQAVSGAAIVAGGAIAPAPSASAITIPVACSENDLVAAVNQANSTSAADTLVLASDCTYRMTSVHGSNANGQEALPVITTAIEMIRPATITRSTFLGLASYRIAEVGPTGSLTLTTGVNFTNGKALGDGGAILNFGAVTLTKSSLSGNYASRDGGGLANADTASGTVVTTNTAVRDSGGVYREGGTMTTTNSPISANTTNNCVGSAPGVPDCTH
jgi:hypothetical protein